MPSEQHTPVMAYWTMLYRHVCTLLLHYIPWLAQPCLIYFGALFGNITQVFFSELFFSMLIFLSHQPKFRMWLVISLHYLSSKAMKSTSIPKVREKNPLTAIFTVGAKIYFHTSSDVTKAQHMCTSCVPINQWLPFRVTISCMTAQTPYNSQVNTSRHEVFSNTISPRGPPGATSCCENSVLHALLLLYYYQYRDIQSRHFLHKLA